MAKKTTVKFYGKDGNGRDYLEYSIKISGNSGITVHNLWKIITEAMTDASKSPQIQNQYKGERYETKR